MEQWTTWDYWNTWTAKNGRVIVDPFENRSITKSTVFLWNALTTPLPSGSTTGIWQHFPDANALAGYLRHFLLPTFFEIWLVREEWDENNAEFVTAEDLFSRALQSQKCRYVHDISSMQKVIKVVDEALNSQSIGDCFKATKRAVKKFNSKWSDTPTWCFSLNVYDSPLKAGKHMAETWGLEEYEADDSDEENNEMYWETAEPFKMSPQDWKKVCKKAATDSASSDRFLSVMRECVAF